MDENALADIISKQIIEQIVGAPHFMLKPFKSILKLHKKQLTKKLKSIELKAFELGQEDILKARMERW